MPQRHLTVEAGDVIQILDFRDCDVVDGKEQSTFDGSSPGSSIYADIVVDNHRGLLVLHPDILVSPTRVSESVSCSRRGVISV